MKNSENPEMKFIGILLDKKVMTRVIIMMKLENKMKSPQLAHYEGV